MLKLSRAQRLVIIIGLITSCLTACNKDPAATKPPAKDPEVGVLTLQPQTVSFSRELAGRVMALQSAEVRPQVTGLIQERLFKEGSWVKKGAVLYQIDSATYQAALETAQAQLAKAKVSLDAARNKAERNAKFELVEQGAMSRTSADDQVTAQKQAEADVAVAQAALKTASINVAYTQVKAPISGVVGKSSVTAGALVTANQTTALTTIQQFDPIAVDITRPSTELAQLQNAAQTPVQLLLPDGSTYALTGKLAFADLSVDQTTGMFSVRVEFPNPDKQLLPGMFVRAKLGAGERANALLVPQVAVSRNAAGAATVWVVKADNTVEKRVIQATQALKDQWVVDDGLTAGEQIVVDGLQRVRPNLTVKPVPAKGG